MPTSHSLLAMPVGIKQKEFVSKIIEKVCVAYLQDLGNHLSVDVVNDHDSVDPGG
jgi:hypothetical protein